MPIYAPPGLRRPKLSISAGQGLQRSPRLASSLSLPQVRPLGNRWIRCNGITTPQPGSFACLGFVSNWRQIWRLSNLRLWADFCPVFALHLPSLCPVFAQSLPCLCSIFALSLPDLCPKGQSQSIAKYCEYATIYAPPGLWRPTVSLSRAGAPKAASP